LLVQIAADGAGGNMTNNPVDVRSFEPGC